MIEELCGIIQDNPLPQPDLRVAVQGEMWDGENARVYAAFRLGAKAVDSHEPSSRLVIDLLSENDERNDKSAEDDSNEDVSEEDDSDEDVSEEDESDEDDSDEDDSDEDESEEDDSEEEDSDENDSDEDDS